MSLLLTLPFMVTFLVIPGTIIRAVFLHGAFNPHAAQLASLALMAYGAGLPGHGDAADRAGDILCPPRHRHAGARHGDCAGQQCGVESHLFVWGLHLGVAGLALGTALGAWINVALLTVTGRSRALLAIESMFLQALAPALLAALACGGGAWIGVRLLAAGHGDIAALAAAIVCAGILYGGTVALFRHRLPLSRA